MNENEQELLEGLRALAADSPREAPAYVEKRLLAEFHRRSRARRRNLWWMASSAAAIAAAVAVALWIQPAPRKAGPTVAKVVTSQPSNVATAPVIQPAVRIRKTSARPNRTAMSFYPLPDTEALPPLENATIVRVQLPMSSLRLIGFQINEDRAGERIEADVLVGQDGLARGVRFVR
ncbi:MAG TPA: hypothetical protein VEU96_23760 [Bryobacteraceae bacterium]|nr:hypothetical protein [Bryobacteraceae bacterium]